MCLKRNYRQNSPFPNKKNWHHVAWSLFEARSFEKWWWESASWGLWKTKKKVFQLVTGKARKPDPIRCFFKNFVVTYQPPPLLGHQVSGRFGGENERMWVKGHSLKSHGFLKFTTWNILNLHFLYIFGSYVLCGSASVFLPEDRRPSAVPKKIGVKESLCQISGKISKLSQLCQVLVGITWISQLWTHVVPGATHVP